MYLNFYIIIIALLIIRFLFLLRNNTIYKRFLSEEPNTRLRWILDKIFSIIYFIDFFLFMPAHALANIINHAKDKETTKDDMVTGVLGFVFATLIYFIIPLILPPD
jgi:hypothetical protein